MIIINENELAQIPLGKLLSLVGSPEGFGAEVKDGALGLKFNPTGDSDIFYNTKGLNINSNSSSGLSGRAELVPGFLSALYAQNKDADGSHPSLGVNALLGDRLSAYFNQNNNPVEGTPSKSWGLLYKQDPSTSLFYKGNDWGQTIGINKEQGSLNYSPTSGRIGFNYQNRF